jgi:hypothetical protein
MIDVKNLTDSESWSSFFIDLQKFSENIRFDHDWLLSDDSLANRSIFNAFFNALRSRTDPQLHDKLLDAITRFGFISKWEDSQDSNGYPIAMTPFPYDEFPEKTRSACWINDILFVISPQTEMLHPSDMWRDKAKVQSRHWKQGCKDNGHSHGQF